MATAVNFDFSANFSQGKRETDEVTRRLEKQEQVVRALQRELRQMGRRLEETEQKGHATGRSFEQAFGAKAIQQLKALATAITGAGGILAAYRLVTAEFERQIELQKEQAAAQITLAQAHHDVSRTMPGASPAEISGVFASLKEMAGRTNIEERFLAAGMAQALSSTRGNVPVSLAAVERAARYMADRPEEIGRFSGSLLDVAAVTGTTDPRINQGMMSFTAGMSRVVNPQQVATSIPRALVGMAGAGATPAEAAALFASLSMAAKDPEGRTTGTAAIALATRLEQEFPQFGTMGQRIAYLQRNPELAQKFYGKGEGIEKMMQIPIRQLLMQPGSEAAAGYAANLGMFPGIEALGGIADAQLAARGLSPYEPVAQQTRVFGEGGEALRLAGRRGAMAATARAGLESALQGADVDVIRRWMAKARYEADVLVGQDPIETAVGILGDLAATREASTTRRMPAGASFVRTSEVPPTREALEQARLLREMIDELQGVRNNTRGSIEIGPYADGNESVRYAQ